MVRTKLSKLKPATLVVYSTPGVSARIFSTSLDAAAVRSSEAAFGSCMLT